MKEKIEDYIRSLGLDTFGMIPMRSFDELLPFYQKRVEKNLQNEFEEKDLMKRIHPAHYMEDGKTIISIAFPYLHAEELVNNGFSVYTKRLDYHRVVHQYLDKICAYVEQLGGKAVGFVDSNTLPERYIAYLAGVGFVGRNNMIITEKYGSYVFLGEIITDLVLPCCEVRSYEKLSSHQECGSCNVCYSECPTKSINAGRVNPNVCLSYLTQKKEISAREIDLLKENVFGCDYCQLKCPYNKKAVMGTLSEFAAIESMNQPVKAYADMDNKYFKSNVSISSCGWRGKNVIRRNAIIQMAKQGEDVTGYLGDSPYINEYVKLLQEGAVHSNDNNET